MGQIMGRITAAILAYYDGKTHEAVYDVYVGRLLKHGSLNVNSKHTRLVARVPITHLCREAHLFNAEIARQFASVEAPPAPWYRD
jgi:hypothetical protein